MVKLGAVVAEFNFDITQMMFDLAREHAKFLDSEIIEVITVPEYLTCHWQLKTSERG